MKGKKNGQRSKRYYFKVHNIKIEKSEHKFQQSNFFLNEIN